jgi:FkbM family methyltransferase
MVRRRSRRNLRAFFTPRALWHLQFIPSAFILFKSPVALLANYIGFRSDTRNYSTRTGACFLNVTAEETEALVVVYLKREYGEFDVAGDVIDIGANIGAFTLLSAGSPKTKRVLAFEPMLDTFHRLEANVSRSAGRERVICVQSAVAGMSGFVRIIPGENSQSNSTSEVIELPDNTTTAVPAISLASIFDAYDVQECALLKVDCEGAEYGIFEGLPPPYFKRIRAIRMEVHRRGDGRCPEELCRLIEKQGFLIEKPLHYGVIWFRQKET